MPAAGQNNSGFRGRLAAEIERLCRAGETARLRVVREARLGMIVIEDGRLVHAQVLESTGEEALREIFSWPEATWEVLYGFRAAKHSITRPYQEVLRDLVGGRYAAPIEVAPPLPEPVPTLAPPAPVPPRRRLRRLALALVGLGTASAVLVVMSWLEHHAALLRGAVERASGRLRPLVMPTTAVTSPPPSITRVLRPVFDRLGPEWLVADVVTIWVPLFATSGVAAAASTDVYAWAAADAAGWVELLGPYGRRLGARLIPVRSPYRGTLFVRPSVAEALGLVSNGVGKAAVRGVRWRRSTAPQDIEFSLVRRLPRPYCEHPYAAGLALEALRRHGLAPGMHVIAEGPRGLQSVRLQMMDRGNPAELWLSRLAREALGVTSRWTRITLHVSPAFP